MARTVVSRRGNGFGGSGALLGMQCDAMAMAMENASVVAAMGYGCSYDKCSQVTVEWVGSNEACLRYYAVAGDKTF